jgi:hypothetical protein
MMELRAYTLAGAEALKRYTTEFWPRHIRSLGKYGITVRGVWVDAGAAGHRVIALVEYPQHADPSAIAEKYRASRDFAADHADFDASLIISTQCTPLEPIAAAPLPENL